MSAPPNRVTHLWCWRERGTASLEVVTLVPIILLVGTLMLQLGVAVWTMVAADTAARQVARAVTLGERNPEAAANRSLPGVLSVSQWEQSGRDDEVRITLSVDVPRVSFLPLFTVKRDAVMPRISS